MDLGWVMITGAITGWDPVMDMIVGSEVSLLTAGSGMDITGESKELHTSVIDAIKIKVTDQHLQQ